MDLEESFIYNNSHDNHWLALHHDIDWLYALLMKRDELFRGDVKVFNFDNFISKLSRLPIDPVDYYPSSYGLLLEDMFACTLDNELLKNFHVTDSVHRFIQYAERIVLLLAMAPYLRPELLDCFRVQDDLGREIAEFGGVSAGNFVGFLPTGETAMYILAGRDLKKRALVQTVIHPKHYLFKQGILSLSCMDSNIPPLGCRLVLSNQYIDSLVRGQDHIAYFDKPSDDEQDETE